MTNMMEAPLLFFSKKYYDALRQSHSKYFVMIFDILLVVRFLFLMILATKIGYVAPGWANFLIIAGIVAAVHIDGYGIWLVPFVVSLFFATQYKIAYANLSILVIVLSTLLMSVLPTVAEKLK